MLSLLTLSLSLSPPPPPGASWICHDRCFASADGECDDGGHGSAYNICPHGSDCLDCGTRPSPDSAEAHNSERIVFVSRNQAAPPSPPGATTHCSDHCFAAGDGDCDDGGHGSTWAVCPHGSDCADCGHRLMSPSAPPSPVVMAIESGPATRTSPAACTNTCFHNSDGDCDDGGEGSHFSFCDHGTDCEDCGTRLLLPSGPFPAPPAIQQAAGLGNSSVAPSNHVLLCDDSCWHTSDGECDDGGAGSQFSLCDPGSDCSDCGHRVFHADHVPVDATVVSTSEPGALKYKLVKPNVECASPDARLGDFGELRHCAEACANTPGCNFFIFGKGSKLGHCWAELTASYTCPEGFEPDDYDFFALHDQPAAGMVRTAQCSNDCLHAGDDECDDGGVGSAYSFCPLGSDCSDCGIRYLAGVPDVPAPSTSAPSMILPPPPPAPSPPPPPPPPPVVTLWLRATVPADVRSSHDEIFYAVSAVATTLAPEGLQHRFHPQFQATNEYGDDDVHPSALPVSIQQIIVYAISYASELGIAVSSIVEAVRDQACAHDDEFERECAVTGQVSRHLSGSAEAERGRTAEISVRRSLHHGETLRVVSLDASRLRRFLDAEAFSAGAQDDASPLRSTAPPVQEALADASLLMLGAAPEVQEIQVKVDVAGWDIDAEDVAALKPALAAPLHLSPQMISVEGIHATGSNEMATPTSPGSDVPRALPQTTGAPTTVFGNGVATEVSPPTTASMPGNMGAPLEGEGAAPDFHVLLAGGLALAACMMLTCCALFAHQSCVVCVVKRRTEGKPGSKQGYCSSADAAENGAMRSVVEAHPDWICAQTASARGVPIKPSLSSSSSTAASSFVRRMPKLPARVLEMGAFDRSKSRAAINPLPSPTGTAAGIGPPGARSYHGKVQTSEILPAELPNPFLVVGLPEPPIRPGVERPKTPVPASRGLAAEDGEHDVSNRACMYDEMSRREEAGERA